ncbi:pyruvate dehydrogenase (acetyl-transferring) E1 component subunit alpha [Saccharibacter sp. 17.LH.SD]|uniref:pyruvate dehydrogenase (acetyl-transferring) E1 component subunit alpha n=1 Tax=Saccharibacter sp. 17.LH.SD TaxID=2689393 RepID=UPI00136838FD|nr:pyruvate dehydrogenase (acetyl-transferring) E1 component subunit alpha [Saccharibacter sp. 17.LH.SD]MXV44252.1 pyruvate dehydrogenase (acetyl-transferring) E1 component subunit alpha [Saccharibacter sp. 17.LH.SD]
MGITVDASSPQNGPVLSKEQMERAYRDMVLVRRFEEKSGQLYGMGKIGGFCHLYIGQEAVVAGIGLAMKKGDRSITSYRDHGQMLVAGMTSRGVMAELTGRSGGYSRGKGGSMHMFSREQEFYGGHGIVGAQVALGTGLGFASAYRDEGRASIVYLGDGAINQGQVYESFNLAALFKLPCLYVVENNRYGMGTAIDRVSASKDLSKNGAPWGIPSRKVDGMDVVAVYHAAQEALEHCRSGKGPFLLEMETYRYRGHSMSDPAKYRQRSEVEEMRQTRDPIETLKAEMKRQGVEESFFKAVDADVKDIVKDAAEFAQTSPEPDESELWTDVLVEV